MPSLLTRLLLPVLLLLPVWSAGESVITGRDPLVDDGTPDGWSGLFVMTPPIAGPEGINEGMVTTFNYWAEASRADGRHEVTPILVRRSEGAYRVFGVGTKRVPDSPGPKSVPFELVEGSDRVDLSDGSTYHIAVLQQWEGGDDNSGSLIPFGNSGGGGMFVENTRGPDHVPLIGDEIASDYSSGSGRRHYSFNFAVEFLANPQPPGDIGLALRELFPGLPVGIEIGTLTTEDPNEGDTHSYELLDDADGVVALEGDKVILTKALGPERTRYLIRLRSTDETDLSVEMSFELVVSAAHPPTLLRLSSTSINGASSPGALVGTLDSSDGNQGDRHLYSLVPGDGDGDNDFFEVTNGHELRLTQSIGGERRVLRLRLRSTDLAGLFDEEALLLHVLSPSFRLNEFVASNVNGRQDENREFSDWIELRNEQNNLASLEGWFLTDDPDDLTKWQFPAVEIPSQGYLLVFASGKDRAVAGRVLHTNFELASEGDFLALVKPDGVTIADQYSFGRQYPDIAFGYDAGGNSQGYLTPTPSGANGGASEFGANQVAFSHERGFYDAAFSLTLTATIPGSIIRYTTNGSKPTRTTGAVYRQPISIRPNTAGTSKGTRVVRAIAVHDGAAVQPVSTHTYLFVNGVSHPRVDGIVGQVVFTSNITGNSVYGRLMDDALLAQPAISIVGGVPGSSEAVRSVEFFDPQRAEPGFQVECGMKLVGGHSVSSPKNNFRMYFRGEYGTSKLRYDLFKDHPYSTGATKVFDRLNLRSGSHDSFFWLANPGNPGRSGGSQRGDAQYLRNRWINDMQFVMGHESLHGRFVHVYVNGAYHGQYQLHEWPNDDYLASYLPGDAEDYEYTNGASGSKTGSDNWAQIWQGLKSAANVSSEAAARWIDLENLADYQILNYYAGNPWDWNPNQNWMAGGPNRPDSPSGGWKFFGWDSDICLQDPNAWVFDKNVPDGLFTTMMRHEEFRMLFRDRVYKHCFHGGALTPDRVQQVHSRRADEIRLSIIAETARWQGAAARPPWDRDDEWEAELARMGNFFQVRSGILLNQLRNNGNWYPVEAPEFALRGGFVSLGHQPVLSASVGTIYFTTDGTDPRLPGGRINSSARAYRVPGDLEINDAMVVRARVRHGSTWSPLNEAGFTLIGTQLAEAGNVTVSEINYHPYDSERYEYIEFRNTSSATVDFTGVTVSGAVHFTFPLGAVVPAGGHIVVVEDEVAFRNRYLDPDSPWFSPGIVVAGEWSGALNNDGEEIVMHDASEEPLLAVRYNDGGAWPGRADGRGSALELADLSMLPAEMSARNAYLERGAHWRATSEFHGSPGRAGLGPDNRVVFNEVLSNSDPPDLDAFELLNLALEDVEIGHWFISDDADDFRKYRIGPETSLEQGAFLVLDEDDFNKPGNPASLVPFALNGSKGDDLFLIEADVTGNLLRFVDRIEFGAAAVGESFGRWPDGKAGDLYPMVHRTLGARNNAGGNTVRVGSVVIAEVHYNPDGVDDGLEFIALCNTGEEPVNLQHWRLRGEVDFNFPGINVAAGAFVVVVDFDPRDAAQLHAFRAKYSLDSVVPVLGPWNDNGRVGIKLSDGGGAIRLLRPDVLVVPVDGSPAYHPMLFEDLVNYNDVAPWPIGPDGAGPSLARRDVQIYGDDPHNWVAGVFPLSGASYATWAANVFPEQLDEASQLPEADADGDGLSNFAEFAFLTDVLRRDGGAPVSIRSDDDGNLLLRFRRRTGAHYLRYEVEVSSDLRTWSEPAQPGEIVSQTELVDGAVEVVVRFLAGEDGEPLFFRVKVQGS